MVKNNLRSRLKILEGILEIFFPKAIGIALEGNDLFVSRVCKRAFNTTLETIKIDDFMINDTVEVKLGATNFQRSLNEIILSIPRESVIIREVDFPGTDIKELKTALEFQLDSFIPFSSEDVYYDIYTVSIKEKSRKILIVAIKKEKLDVIISKLESAGVVPSKVIISPLSFLPLISDRKTNMVMVCKLKDKYSYNTFAHNSFVSTLLISNMEELLRKINVDMPDEIIEDCGLETSFKSICENSDIFVKHENRDINEEETVDKKTIHFSSIKDNQGSYGAALYGIQTDKQKFSLLNTGRRVINLQKVFMFGFSGALLLFLFLIPHVMIKRKLEVLDFVDKEIKLLKDDIFRIENIRNRLVDMEETLTSVGKVQADYAIRIKTFLELSEKLPKTAWIKEMYIYRKIFEIGGIALSATDLIPLLENSDLFYNVGLTAPVVKTLEGNESFRIKGEIKIESNIIDTEGAADPGV